MKYKDMASKKFPEFEEKPTNLSIAWRTMSLTC